MARRTKNELIQCEYCGEWYSTSYRHCPFCNEDGTGRWDDPETFAAEEDNADYGKKGGRRLAQSAYEGPSVLRLLGTALSLGLIVAAVCIVFSVVKPLLGGGDPVVETTPSPGMESPVVESEVVETPDPTQPEEPGISEEPIETTPAVQESPAALESQAPVSTPVPTTPSVSVVAPTAFKLSREDFTMSRVGEIYQLRVTYTPADARGDISWKSSDPNVASVSWDGTVTAVSSGTVTVTATVAGVGSKTCTVRCNLKSGSSGDSSGSTSTSTGSVSLNRTDFTLSQAGETWKLVVEGTSSAATWATSDSSVATVGSDGTVTAVGKGVCKVTATVNGTKLTCTVRCNF